MWLYLWWFTYSLHSIKSHSYLEKTHWNVMLVITNLRPFDFTTLRLLWILNTMSHKCCNVTQMLQCQHVKHFSSSLRHQVVPTENKLHGDSQTFMLHGRNHRKEKCLLPHYSDSNRCLLLCFRLILDPRLCLPHCQGKYFIPHPTNGACNWLLWVLNWNHLLQLSNIHAVPLISTTMNSKRVYYKTPMNSTDHLNLSKDCGPKLLFPIVLLLADHWTKLVYIYFDAIK